MRPSYTHADHARRCRLAAQSHEVLQQFVQVRMAGASCCGKIVNAWDTADGMAMWKIQFLGPVQGVWSIPVHRVTQCSGLDGRCVCHPNDSQSAAEGDRAERATHEAQKAAGGVTCL